jgi:hypothetical protein
VVIGKILTSRPAARQLISGVPSLGAVRALDIADRILSSGTDVN